MLYGCFCKASPLPSFLPHGLPEVAGDLFLESTVAEGIVRGEPDLHFTEWRWGSQAYSARFYPRTPTSVQEPCGSGLVPNPQGVLAESVIYFVDKYVYKYGKLILNMIACDITE